MKKVLVGLLVLLVLSVCATAWADVWVNGYFRSDGTYVPGYFRSSPNNTVTDNYSFYGNVNPSTGAIGTNRYYSAPSSPYYNPLRSYSYGSSPPSYSPYGSYSSPYSTYNYSQPSYNYSPSIPRLSPWPLTLQPTLPSYSPYIGY